MKKSLTILAVLLFAGLASYAGQRVANAYKATKLNATSVLISCNDEREPQVTKMDNKTMIVVTCKQ